MTKLPSRNRTFNDGLHEYYDVIVY